MRMKHWVCGGALDAPHARRMREHHSATEADDCIAPLVNTKMEQVGDRTTGELEAKCDGIPNAYHLGRLRPVSARLVESKARVQPPQATPRRNRYQQKDGGRMMVVTSREQPVAVNTPGGDAKEAEGEVNPNVELCVSMRDDWLCAC